MPITTATPSVADLVLRMREGDPVAWEEIVRRYGKLVSTTVRSFQLQDADALDAVQMTWLQLAENAHQVQLPERLGGWLIRQPHLVMFEALSLVVALFRACLVGSPPV
jgi:DNA-directed RNA polymerase specialized sigma24 family protein